MRTFYHRLDISSYPAEKGQWARSSRAAPRSFSLDQQCALPLLPRIENVHFLARHSLGGRRAAPYEGKTVGSHTYTAYVVAPSRVNFDQVWKKLQQQIYTELRRRGLWEMSPIVLGIQGRRWDEVIDELLQEVFLYVFVERLENLRKKLATSQQKNIDGIVVLQIRHCLTALQRNNDPIGYRVYELSLSAVDACVTDGKLVVRGDEKVRNETVLEFSGTSMSSDIPPGDVLPPERLNAWMDRLLPDLMTARYRAVAPVVKTLGELIIELRDEGVDSFRFKDLVDPLKNETRRRWLSIWSEGTSTDVPAYRDADLHGLSRCVNGKIDGEQRKKTREDLFRTWTFLRATNAERNGHKPSRFKLAQEIGIDRSRVDTLLGTLKRMVEECLSGQSREARR